MRAPFPTASHRFALRLASALALLAPLALIAPAAAQLSLPPDYLWRQLSPLGEAGSSVRFLFEVDPRGEWVVFVGDVENTGSEAVYAIRRNGSALHRLSAYGAPQTIQSLELPGDGRRVVYSGDLETNGRREIWSAPVPGTPADAVKLNVAATGDGVVSWAVAENGSQVAYIAETSQGEGFWCVPIAGPAAAGVRLDPETVGDEILGGLAISPDGARAILYLADFTAGTSRIWSVPPAGPLGAGLFLLDAGDTECFLVGGGFSTPTARFVYILTCDTPNGYVPNQIWSVPAAGPASAAQSLAGSFVDGGALTSLRFEPQQDRLVFIADKSVDERFELWSVEVDGTAASLVKLNPALVGGGDVTDMAVSPDQTRVVYIADQTTNEVYRAWSVPIAGPSTEAVPLVSGAVATGADVTHVEFTSDSSTVVFRADLSLNDRFDLYSAPADGSEIQERITNDSSIPGPDRSTGTLWKLHPDGRRVAFTVDVAAPGDQRRLYEQRLAPRYVQDARLNGEPVAGGSVSAIVVFPDSAGTLYYSDELSDDDWHLFTVDSRLFGDGFEEGTLAAWPDSP